MASSRLVQRVLPVLITLPFVAPAAAHARSLHAQVVTKQGTAGPYTVVLRIGAPEKMMGMGMGATSGEIMSGGQNPTCRMTTMGGMRSVEPDATRKVCNHHIEVHVLTRSTRKTVLRAAVSITMTDAKKHMTIRVPIMHMYDAKLGIRDYHYGNNIYAGAAAYTVAVTVNGKHATFSVRLM